MLGFDIYSANSISARHFYRHSIPQIDKLYEGQTLKRLENRAKAKGYLTSRRTSDHFPDDIHDGCVKVVKPAQFNVPKTR